MYVVAFVHLKMTHGGRLAHKEDCNRVGQILMANHAIQEVWSVRCLHVFVVFYLYNCIMNSYRLRTSHSLKLFTVAVSNTKRIWVKSTTPGSPFTNIV